MEQTVSEKPKRAELFVASSISRISNGDNAFRASMSRADNPDSRSQAWEYLAKWCDLERENEVLSFALLGAAIAKAKPSSNGRLGLGEVLRSCYGDEDSPAKARLRRLLSCDSVKETCEVLRPALALVSSKGGSLDYARLLDELLRFGDGDFVHRKWAKGFYGSSSQESAGEEAR